MTIYAVSVTGYGPSTVVIDNTGVSHPVPPEGLSVVVLTPITVASGETIPVTVGGSTVVFQQPVESALDIESVDGVLQAMPTGTAATIRGALNE